MIDLHSHILPGVDDGARSWEESLAMCRMASEDGIRVMFATPHYQSGGYEAGRRTAAQGVTELNRRLRDEKIDLEIRVGNEVLAQPSAPELLASGAVATYGDAGRYMLLEFPHQGLPLEQAQELVFQICLKGYIPIIAHPERNFLIRQHPEMLETLVQQGALAQVTAMCLATGRDPLAKKLCLGWARQGLLHFVATDAHNLNDRSPQLRAAHDALRAALPPEAAKAVCEDYPLAVLEGRSIEPAAGSALSLDGGDTEPEIAPKPGLVARLFGGRS